MLLTNTALSTDATSILTLAPLTLTMANAYEPETGAGGRSSDDSAASASARTTIAGRSSEAKAAKGGAGTGSPTYGHAGAQALTFGGLYANNFQDANDFNLHIAYSNFLADDLEFAVELGGWFFNQPGEDTGGISGSMVFRWHFWHADDYDWSVFADVGIGLLGAFDNVPEGGTSFDFLPRAGVGFTKALDDSAYAPRLMLGVRWHHISNARIEGNENNPARDSIAVYAAIVFPF